MCFHATVYAVNVNVNVGDYRDQHSRSSTRITANFHANQTTLITGGKEIGYCGVPDPKRSKKTMVIL